MELIHAIKKRRTIHLFTNEIVPKKVIQRSIEAANQAPCHRLTFPWRFTSIGQNKRKLLFELQLKLKFGDKRIDEKDKDRIRAKFLNPSHLLIASQLSTDNQIQTLEDYASCACAIQNLSLSLASEGVGSKWSTGKITSHLKTYKLAEINPKEEAIIGFIWIGYGKTPAAISRPSMELIFRETD